jgi:hypothetical protein
MGAGARSIDLLQQIWDLTGNTFQSTIKQLDPMPHRNGSLLLQVDLTPNVGGHDELRPPGFKVLQLPFAELARQVVLQNRIYPRRSTAHMAVRYRG